MEVNDAWQVGGVTENSVAKMAKFNIAITGKATDNILLANVQ